LGAFAGAALSQGGGQGALDGLYAPNLDHPIDASVGGGKKKVAPTAASISAILLHTGVARKAAKPHRRLRRPIACLHEKAAATRKKKVHPYLNSREVLC
jgi:hypothetical protein